MKIATWNVNSLNVRLPQVLAWLAQTSTDTLLLQEIKMIDDHFPASAFSEAGYHAQCFGQKTYNGVAIISRHPITDITYNIPHFEDPQARVISATIAGIRTICAYIPNGQAPGTDKFEYKMKWLQALETWISQEINKHPELILAGDYNIAPEDRDVYDPMAWKDQILCTPQERQHFQNLIGMGLSDAFRLFEQEPKLWSWWDYRNLSYQKNRGLRIDHILVSHALKDCVKSCSIDKAPRKNERPSDHTPVVIELEQQYSQATLY
ncbi:MAG: exodeoxyribonuclease III [Saezia sp.]